MLHFKQFFKINASLQEQNCKANWVLFIHGAGGSSAIWHKQLKAYRKSFNVLLIDLRGHGKSAEIKDVYNKEYTFEFIARDVIEVVEYLQMRSIHLVGVSLGTIVMRQMAEIRPDLVKSMVMTGAISRLTFKSRFFVGLGRIFKNILPYMILYRFFAWVIMPKKNHAKSRKTFIDEAKHLCQKEFLKWFTLTKHLGAILNRYRTEEINIPTLYVMGSEDHMFLETIKQQVVNWKKATLEVVEECGHVVNIEKSKIFNEISLSFLLRQI